MEEQRRNDGEAFWRVEGLNSGEPTDVYMTCLGQSVALLICVSALMSRSNVQASRLGDAPRPRKGPRNSRNRTEST